MHTTDIPATPPLASLTYTKLRLRAELGGISDRKFDELRATGVIPAPLQLGPRLPLWTYDDLLEALRRLPRRDRTPEPETLAVGRRARIARLKARSDDAAPCVARPAGR